MVTPKQTAIIHWILPRHRCGYLSSDGFNAVIKYTGRSAHAEVVGRDRVAQRQPIGGAGRSGRDDTPQAPWRPVDIAAAVLFLVSLMVNG